MLEGDEEDAARRVGIVESRTFIRSALATALEGAGCRVIAEGTAAQLAEASGDEAFAAVVVGPGQDGPAPRPGTVLVRLCEGEVAPAPAAEVTCDVRRVGLDLLVTVLVTGHTDRLRVGQPTAPEDVKISLTPRELDVLRAIAGGASSRTAADQLGIQPKTVENHKESIFVKLGAQSQAQAVALARAAGLLDGLVRG